MKLTDLIIDDLQNEPNQHWHDISWTIAETHHFLSREAALKLHCKKCDFLS